MKKWLALLAIGIVTAAGAAPPLAKSDAQWSIDTVVIDGSPWNKLQVCLKADNTWYSTEQRKGSGRWLISGRRLLIHGKLDALLVSADVAMTSPTTMTGNVQQWINGSLTADNQSNLFATSTWTFVSATCTAAF